MTDNITPRFKDESWKPPKRRKPINPVSVQKRIKDNEYRKQRVLACERADGLCEYPTEHAPGCNGQGTECHHIIPRSLGGTHELENLCWISRACHEQAEATNSAAWDERPLF